MRETTCPRPEKLSTCPRPDRQQVPVRSQSVAICTKALLHPLIKYRRSTTFEVGLTQTLGSLRERGIMWPHQTPEEVHLVVLIKLLEVLSARYVTGTGESISCSHVRNSKFLWPTSKPLPQRRTLEQEFYLRSIRADREAAMQQILCDIKAATKEYLHKRRTYTYSAFVEPIDATICLPSQRRQ